MKRVLDQGQSPAAPHTRVFLASDRKELMLIQQRTIEDVRKQDLFFTHENKATRGFGLLA